ncbi:MAG: hypothetical protein COA78_35695 [Blastopirellula sp.]|nr:MAG: hypothetical protein COA78_35695 [Blastopirellula sp.]
MPIAKILSVVVKSAITVSILYWIISSIELEEVIQEISAIQLWIIPMIFLVFLVQMVLTSRRQQVVVIANCGPLFPMQSLRIAWIGAWFGQLFISFFGSDAIRVIIFRQIGFKLSSSMLAVLIERLSGLFSHITFVAVTLPFLIPMMNDSYQIIGVILLVTSLYFVFLVIAFAHRIQSIMPIPIIKKTLSPFSEASRDLGRNPKLLLSILLLSLIINILNILIVYLIAIGLKADLSFLDVTILLPTILLISLLPISLAGWGVREGVMVAGFGLVGITVEMSVSISLLFGIFTLISCLPGALLWFINTEKR